MKIIPAIDILNGQCVRLTKGDYGDKKVYNSDPISVAQKFATDQADIIHIVDLDGAKEGAPVNISLISQLTSQVSAKIQVGGGIRNMEIAQKYFEAGVDRIIIGTKALEDTQFVIELIEKFNAEKIVIAIDVKGEEVATDGWITSSNQNYKEFAKTLQSIGVSEVIATDISRDGTLTEPNFYLYQELCGLGLNVIASGGVSSEQALSKLAKIGCAGAIVGKAIYEGLIDLRSAIEKFNS